MYPYNNNNNDNNGPIPSARLPSRPRYGGEEYPMQQVPFNNNNPPPFPTSPNESNPFYDPTTPNDVQRPLLVNADSTTSSVTLDNGNGAGVRFTNNKSNMIGGGPEMGTGIGPRRQTRRYKTSKQKI